MSLFGMRYHSNYKTLNEYIQSYLYNYLKQDKNLKFDNYKWNISVKNYVVTIQLNYEFPDFNNWNIWTIDKTHEDLTTHMIKIKDELLKALNSLNISLTELSFINNYKTKDITRTISTSLKIPKSSLKTFYGLARLSGYHITDYGK
ncbi:MAG: hypothetical protein IJ880_11755 [Bacilli bacterium]|nr:hypothetical protein [Bacilli bacterium]